MLLKELMSLVELVELLEGERVDRPEEPELALELTHPTGGRGPLGQLGQGRLLSGLGLDVEVTPQRLDRGLETEAGLGLIEIGAMGALARGLEGAFRLHPGATYLVELRGHLPDLVALPSAALAQFGVDRFDLLETGRDIGRQALHRQQRTLDLESAVLSAAARVPVGIETGLGLGDTPTEELLALAESGSPHLEIAPSRGEHRGAGLDRGLLLTHPSRGLGLSALVGLERRQHRLHLGDPSPLRLEVADEITEGALHRLALPGEFAPSRLRALESLRRRVEPTVVEIEPPTDLHLRRPSAVELGRCRSQLAIRGLQRGLCRLRRRDRVGEGGGRRATRGGSDTPTVRRETITLRGHHRQRRIGKGDVDRAIDVVSHDRAREQRREEFGNTGRRRGDATEERTRTVDRTDRLSRSPASGDDRARRAGPPQGRERPARRTGPIDHDRRQGVAESGFDRVGPSVLDGHQLEQGAEHTVDADQALGSGSGPGRVDGHLQCLGPGDSARARLGALLTGRRRAFHLGPGGQTFGLRRGQLLDERALPRCGFGQLRPKALDVLVEFVEPTDGLLEPIGDTPPLVLRAVHRGPNRPELAADLGGSARRPRARLLLGRSHSAVALRGERLLLRGQLGERGLEPGQTFEHLGQFGLVSGDIGFEGGDQTGVHQLTTVALETPATLREDAGQPSRPLAQLLRRDELVPDIVLATGGQAGFDGERLGVEPRQVGLRGLLGRAGLDPDGLDRLEAGPHGGDLATGDVDAQGIEFALEVTVTLGGLGLTLEGAQLAADLADEVLQAQQVGLGGIEATLGLLLALAELEDARGLFDDRSTFLGPGVENGIDLPLAHDHVLLPAHAGIRQQFLDVEQPARDPVDGVLAVAGAEQDAGDGHLVELDRQQTGGVVEGQADLGASEGRALRRAGEDHVVHLLRPDGLGGLRAEHPGDCVDDIGLAGAVGADDHRHPGLERHLGGVGERLEALEGETLQEHGGTESTPPPLVGTVRQRWQTGQWWVPRWATVERLTIPRPQVPQRSPARACTRCAVWYEPPRPSTPTYWASARVEPPARTASPSTSTMAAARRRSPASPSASLGRVGRSRAR